LTSKKLQLANPDNIVTNETEAVKKLEALDKSYAGQQLLAESGNGTTKTYLTNLIEEKHEEINAKLKKETSVYKLYDTKKHETYNRSTEKVAPKAAEIVNDAGEAIKALEKLDDSVQGDQLLASHKDGNNTKTYLTKFIEAKHQEINEKLKTESSNYQLYDTNTEGTYNKSTQKVALNAAEIVDNAEEAINALKAKDTDGSNLAKNEFIKTVVSKTNIKAINTELNKVAADEKAEVVVVENTPAALMKEFVTAGKDKEVAGKLLFDTIIAEEEFIKVFADKTNIGMFNNDQKVTKMP
jgi:hypothetical protein